MVDPAGGSPDDGDPWAWGRGVDVVYPEYRSRPICRLVSSRPTSRLSPAPQIVEPLRGQSPHGLLPTGDGRRIDPGGASTDSSHVIFEGN